MKKLLLLAVSIMMGMTMYARDADTAGDEQTKEPLPEWTISLTCNVHKSDVYESIQMENMECQFNGNDVYGGVITLEALEEEKECKYALRGASAPLSAGKLLCL